MKFASKLENPIFQPYLNKKEISIDGWVGRESNLPGIVVRSRSLISNGESKITTILESKTFEKKIHELISYLSIKGPFVIQAFIEGDDLTLIECNPRIGGSTTVSVENGLKIFLWSILEIIDPSFKPVFTKKYKSITQVRTQSDNYLYDHYFD